MHIEFVGTKHMLIDEGHFHSCTICAHLFLKSYYYCGSESDEEEFQRNIQRQSTIVPSNINSKLVVDFVANAESIKDLKK